VLPFVLFLVINFMSPIYFEGLKGHPVLVPAVVVGLLLLAVGNFAIYRMVNFRV
jgi:tight adherence protein B